MSIFEAGRLLLSKISDDELPESATINRLLDGAGTYTSSDGGYTEIATGVPCRVGKLEANQAQFFSTGNKLNSTTDSLITFALGTDIRPQDTITLINGRTFSVEGDYSPNSELAMTQVRAIEVK